MQNTVVYEDVDSGPRVAPLISMSLGELVRVVLCGIGVGLIVGVVYYLMNKFVFGAVLCRPQAPADCSQAPNYAFIVAMIIGSIAGIATLVRLRVYRPLLAVLAVAIALWGIHAALSGVVWYWALLAAMVLFGIAYGLFAWLARIRSFILAIVVTIVVVVIVRLFLAA